MTAPTVCPRCEGTRIQSLRWGGRGAADWIPEPCEQCCTTPVERRLAMLPERTPMELCECCGEPTSTPPLCARCDNAQDAAYERGQDR